MMRTKSDECRVSSVETVTRRGDVYRHSGFTLIEMVIVMALATILGVITISSGGRITANNRAQTCMMNLRHIHQALMIYRADYDAYPAFLYSNPDAANSPTRLGLWALHTYDGTPAAEAPYLKSYKRFKCPHDDDTSQLRTNEATVTVLQPLNTPPLVILPPCGGANQPPCPAELTGFVSNYNSYQTIDLDDQENTYQPYRGWADPRDGNYLRQLLPPSCVYDPSSQYQGTAGCPAGYSPRLSGTGFGCVIDPNSRFVGQTARTGLPPPNDIVVCGANQRPSSLGLSMQKWEPRGDAVVTWCQFHRNRTQPYQYDNVLFLDGSVQLLPSVQWPGSQYPTTAPSYPVDGTSPDCTDAAGTPQGCCATAMGSRNCISGTQYTPKANLLWQRCHKKAGT